MELELLKQDEKNKKSGIHNLYNMFDGGLQLNDLDVPQSSSS